MSQWVQHVSGQGEKWEVIADYDDRGDLAVKSKEPSTFAGTHFLPKSEYRLCPAPERWEDVTGECYTKDCTVFHQGHGQETKWCCVDNGYRLRKVTGMGKPAAVPVECAFIVERKVS